MDSSSSLSPSTASESYSSSSSSSSSGQLRRQPQQMVHPLAHFEASSSPNLSSAVAGTLLPVGVDPYHHPLYSYSLVMLPHDAPVSGHQPVGYSLADGEPNFARYASKSCQKRNGALYKKSSESSSKKIYHCRPQKNDDRRLRKKKKTVHSRCSLKSLKSLLEELNINEDQWKLLNATPFGLFFDDLPDIVMEIGMLDVLICAWNSDTNTFKLASKDVPFKIEDVVIITGLKNSGERVEFSNIQVKAPIYMELFSKGKLLRKTIAERIKDIGGDGKENENETLVKLLILYLFNCLLFSPSNYKLHDRFAHYVSDLQTLHEWNWAEAIYRYLVCQLNYVSSNMGNRNMRDNDKNVGYIGGFSLLILVWYWEHTKTKEPLRPDSFPRLKRWKHESYRSRNDFLEEFDNLKQDEVMLELFLSEYEKELVGATNLVGVLECKSLDSSIAKSSENAPQELIRESVQSYPRKINLSWVKKKLNELDSVVAEQFRIIEAYREDYLGTLPVLMSKLASLEGRVLYLETSNKKLREKLGVESFNGREET